MIYSKTLYLLRHADAIESEHGAIDLERELTETGRAQCEHISATMKDISFDTILCSTARRTTQTAELALPEKKIQKLRQLYNASAANILAQIAENVPSRAKKILIIAHNPGLSDLTRQFSTVGHSSLHGLNPGDIAIIDVSGEWNDLNTTGCRFNTMITLDHPASA